MTKSFSELIKLQTFEERFSYLSLVGAIGEETFGFDRWVNQHFYRSREWRRVRNHVIVRDGGCDLAIPERLIAKDILVHHINPITAYDIEISSDKLLDPDNLITTSLITHNAIHYGSLGTLPSAFVERKPGDTKLW